MKIALIFDPEMGLASGFMVKYLTNIAVQKAEYKLIDAIEEADIVLVAGEATALASALSGKKVFVSDAQTLLRDPVATVQRAIDEAQFASINASPAVTEKVSNAKRLVALTACPTGVAHTFMAAEALTNEAKKRGWWVKVETRGSVGAANQLSGEEIAAADLVVIAADIEVDLAKFAGKTLYRTSTGLALKKTAQTLDNALAQAQLPAAVTRAPTVAPTLPARTSAYQHLLTGVSYMLPMVVAGGLCIALSFMFGLDAHEKPGSLAAALMIIGKNSAFTLMVPVLAGYIAFSIADRPGLTPGLIGGMIAFSVNSGFLGGIAAGFIAGYCARFLSHHVRLPQSLESLKPILIIPPIASLFTGLLMLFVVGTPVAAVMQHLTHWLSSMETANAVILGALLGGMMCSDMGGPINKVAYAFGVGLLSAASYGPMAAIMAAGMVPPLAMGLATLLAANKYTKNQQQGGKAALVLGLCFITEGAIPYAARDPMRVIPCAIFGGATTGAIAMALHTQLMTPHGGLFVLLIPGVVKPVLGFLIAILAGTLVTAVSYVVIKRPEETA